MSEPIVIPTSRRKMALSVGAALVFVAVGLGLVLWDEDPADVVFGWAAILFFGGCAVFALLKLVKPTPAVVLDNEGIHHRAPLGASFVAWEEVGEIRPFVSRGHTFLGIMPKDLDAFLARQPWWKRLSIRLDLLIGWPAVFIPESGLPMSAVELMRVIDRRFKRQTE